jgi:hypothetical protein
LRVSIINGSAILAPSKPYQVQTTPDKPGAKSEVIKKWLYVLHTVLHNCIIPDML